MSLSSLSSRGTNRLRELYHIILTRMWTSNARLFESPSRRPFPAVAPSLEQLEDRLMLSSTLFPTGMQDITTSAYGANSLFAVDLDGDGDMDVLSASEYDDRIAWYENIDALGTFGPQQVISASADGARPVFAASLLETSLKEQLVNAAIRLARRTISIRSESLRWVKRIERAICCLRCVVNQFTEFSRNAIRRFASGKITRLAGKP